MPNKRDPNMIRMTLRLPRELMEAWRERVGPKNAGPKIEELIREKLGMPE